jgi:hypothetical protein
MMRRMHPVLCFGEALIDFVPLEKGQRLADVDTFARVPGGAPANVAACVARLGGTAQFVGQVGRDAFGDCIERALRELGVNTTWLRRTTAAKTALAFVTLSAAGERDFVFYRDPSADMLFPRVPGIRGGHNRRWRRLRRRVPVRIVPTPCHHGDARRDAAEPGHPARLPGVCQRLRSRIRHAPGSHSCHALPR